MKKNSYNHEGDVVKCSATLSKLRTSPIKLNMVASLIRRMSAYDALNQLKFSKRRIAQDVRKCLLSAIANAEHNHGMDVDSLKISEVRVGKSLVMKRHRPRARGRAGKILKFFSNITIVLAENQG